MRDVAVVGSGQTKYGKHLDTPLRALAHVAVRGALADAGVTLDQIEAAYCSNAIAGLITGQEMVRGQVALRTMGFGGIPIVNCENACASASTALHLAWTAVAAGVHDVVLVLGAEKMTHADKRVSIMAVATALDVEQPVDPNAVSPFMSVYAEKVRHYLDESTATVEDFGAVVCKAQANGALNPVAQYGSHMSVEEVLASPMVAEPLTRLMCSPIGDGAAAVVIASPEAIERLGLTDPVWIRASVLGSGSDPGQGPQVGERVAAMAYERAGLGPDDLDVIELHDATASAEIMRYETLGLASVGEGASLIREGVTSITGRLPVNPSGGLLARGHPIGATGLAQIVELADQLRGRCGDHQIDGARIGLAENGGGWIGGDSAADCIHILTR
ncbi:MAG: thiolase family protein [Solirubrobacterales bacterium]